MAAAQVTTGADGEPAELRGLPAEVRALVHAVDALRDGWAEAGEARRRELWTRVHDANDVVWDREVTMPGQDPEQPTAHRAARWPAPGADRAVEPMTMTDLGGY